MSIKMVAKEDDDSGPVVDEFINDAAVLLETECFQQG